MFQSFFKYKFSDPWQYFIAQVLLFHNLEQARQARYSNIGLTNVGVLGEGENLTWKTNMCVCEKIEIV